MGNNVIHDVETARLRSDNIRHHLDEEAIKGLAESMRAVGQLYPIRVRPEGDGYSMVDGDRRRASFKEK